MAGKPIDVGVKFTGDDSGFQKVINNINRSVGDVKKSMTGLQTVLGGAAMLGAIELGKKAWGAYEKVMSSTEGTSEKLEQQISLLDGSMTGLIRTIATGSWETLISNITRTAEATRDAKEATQELEHITAGNTIARGRLSLGLQESRTSAIEADTPEEKKKYYNEAVEFQRQLTQLNVSEIAARLKIDEDYYLKITGHSKEYFDYFLGQVPKLAQNYEYYFGKDSVVLEGLQARLADLKYMSDKGLMTPALEKERHELQLTAFVLEDYRKIQDDFSKKGQWDEFVKGIGEMALTAASGEKALVRLLKQIEAVDNKIEKSTITRSSGPSALTVSNKSILPSLIGAENDKNGLLPNMTMQLTEGIGIAETAVKNLDSAFEDLFINTGGGFQGMIDSMMNSLEMLFAKLIGKAALFGLLQLLFPGSGMAVSALSGLRNFVGIPGFAGGTNFAPGGLAWVGERGPELVNLPRGSKVIPNVNSQVEMHGILQGHNIYFAGQRYGNMLNRHT